MSVRLCDNSVGTSLQRIAYVAYRALCLEGDLGFIGISRRFLQLAVDTASDLENPMMLMLNISSVKAGKAAVDAAAAQHEFYKLTHSETNLKRLGFHGGDPPSL